MSSTPNKKVIIPASLQALDRIKKRLADTDRTDHVEEVESNEQKAKDAILKLSAYGHEGVQLLVKQAKEELKIIVGELGQAPAGELLDPVKFMVHQQKLFNMKHLWLWFLGFFGEASASLKEVNDFIAQDQQPDINPEY